MLSSLLSLVSTAPNLQLLQYFTFSATSACPSYHKQMQSDKYLCEISVGGGEAKQYVMNSDLVSQLS